MAPKFSARALRYGLAASGMVIATAPVAFAEESSKKPSIYDNAKPQIYDNDAESEKIVPYPGSSEPAHGHDEKKPATETQSKTAIKSETINGVRVRTSDFLESHVNVARNWLIRQSDKAKAEIDFVFQKYLHAERSVTSTVASLKSDKEDILPGGIYILISTLTGSILARNRNFLVRGAAPIVFGVGAFAYFLPETFQNTRDLTWRFEQRSPALAQYHIQTQKSLENIAKEVRSVADKADQSLVDGVKASREFIEETTGLQINDKNNGKKK